MDWCIHSRQGQSVTATSSCRGQCRDCCCCCCVVSSGGVWCSCCSRLVLKLTVCSHAELWRQLLVGWDDVQGQWPDTSEPCHAGSQHLGGPPLEACKMINIHYRHNSLQTAGTGQRPFLIPEAQDPPMTGLSWQTISLCPHTTPNHFM